MKSIWTRLTTLARRIAADARGNTAMLFGLALPGLILMTLGGVDIHRVSTVRINLQDALDAAALAAARSPYTADADIQRVGMDALRANLAAYPQVTLLTAGTTFRLTEQKIVVADARANVKALVANIFLPPYGQFMDDYLPVGAHSEVNRSSKNLEVSLVLDVTGSMAGQRLTDLKTAAKQLVDIVVQPTQTPYYSKMAIVPYSVGVNLGSYAAGARGAPIQSRNISGASWEKASATNISAVTKASTGQFTSSGHGLQTGDYVWIKDVGGMYQVNDRAYRVVRISNSRFSLEYWTGSYWATLNTSGYNSYSSGGKVQECQLSDCSIVVTANGHGLSNGDTVYIEGVSGMTQINGKGYVVADATTNTYSIGVNGANWGSYSSGGKSWCGNYGCEWRVYWNPYGALKAVRTGTCVSERTGAQAYTDQSPTTAKVGFNYDTSANVCPSAEVMPLTSSKSSLKGLVDGLADGGSTAGQIGAGWGWYMVSPNFNSLWPSSGAGAYDPTNLLKAVIIMTDGDFNTPYCSGVIARDAGSGSGSANDKINCDATNGDPFAQTEALCDAMKARNILIYTVGFQMTAGGRGEQALDYCATSGEAFLPSSGADLSDAFKAIGRDITRLRISK